MASSPLARLRVELEADSAELEKGLDDARAAFQRIATIGSAVGNVIAQGFVALAGQVRQALGEITDVTSDTFQDLSIKGQRAGLVIGQAFAEMQDAAAEMRAELLNRVLPGFAQLADRLASFDDRLGLSTIAVEGLTAALKALATGGALLIAVFESLSHIVASTAQALMAAASGDFEAAWQRIREGAHAVANEVRATASTIANIWNEVSPTPGPGVLGAWDVVVQRSREFRDHLRELRDQMMATLADPTATFAQQHAALQEALQAGVITLARYQQHLRRITEAHEQAMEGALRTVGSALTALFAKSKPAAIASALINTYVGITQALRSLPPPWSFVQAAAVGAMGFAQVRNITSTSESGGGGAPSVTPTTPDAGVGVPSQLITVEGLSGDQMLSMVSTRALIERINDAVANGATVVLK